MSKFGNVKEKARNSHLRKLFPNFDENSMRSAQQQSVQQLHHRIERVLT
jgi:hypothetical protein